MQRSKSPADEIQAQNGASVEQYVSFMLGEEEYAADIRRVQEIKGWDAVTRVPYTPKHVLGVVNLRGAVVPVIDLRIRFGLLRVPFDLSTVIVVVRVNSERGERTVGVVVDAVNEVHDIPTTDIRPAPDMLGGGEFIKGIATLGEKIVILLDIERLVCSSIMDGA